MARRPRQTSLLVLLGFVSCVHADHLLIDPEACIRQGIPIELVNEVPKRPYTEVALIYAGRDTWWSFGTWAEIRRAACREAEKVGAHAILHPRIERDSYSVSVGPLSKGGDTKRFGGIAIRYDDRTERHP